MQIQLKMFLGTLIALAIMSVVSANDPERTIPADPSVNVASLR